MSSSYKGVPKNKNKIEIRLSKEAKAYFVFIEAGLTPLEPFENANQKWKSECQKCGSIVSPRFADVQGGGGGCTNCGREKIVAAQKKRFPQQEKKAMSIAKKAKLEPLEPYKNAKTKWKCKCLKCGEIVTPTFHNLEQGNGGCINCQEFSFQPLLPSYLYVMTHAEMSSLKIGIGNSENKTDRIKTHKRHGWELLRRYDFKQGKQAMTVETSLLKWFRKDLKLQPHLTGDLMKQFGWSETVDLDEIDLPLLFRKIEELIKGLQG
jgi:formylmethanofuran dehydrogenase subunit E